MGCRSWRDGWRSPLARWSDKLELKVQSQPRRAAAPEPCRELVKGNHVLSRTSLMTPQNPAPGVGLARARAPPAALQGQAFRMAAAQHAAACDRGTGTEEGTLPALGQLGELRGRRNPSRGLVSLLSTVCKCSCVLRVSCCEQSCTALHSVISSQSRGRGEVLLLLPFHR